VYPSWYCTQYENDPNVHNDDENLTKNFAVFFVLLCYDVL
jgi:hypothetical protein